MHLCGYLECNKCYRDIMGNLWSWFYIDELNTYIEISPWILEDWWSHCDYLTFDNVGSVDCGISAFPLGDAYGIKPWLNNMSGNGFFYYHTMNDFGE